MGDRKAPTPPPTNQSKPVPPPPPPRKIPDGGEAFARPTTNYCDGARGMSLRDYFAAAALPAVLAARTALRDADAIDLNQESIAEECYELADALLEARGKDA